MPKAIGVIDLSSRHRHRWASFNAVYLGEAAGGGYLKKNPEVPLD